MPAPKNHKPYPGCENGGRPEKYTKAFIEKEADAFLEWMKSPESLYFKRFAINRGYHPNRLAEFAEQNEKFLGVYEKAKAWQEVRLVEGGLLSEFNAGFTKFIMGNVCGWVDRQETKVSGDAANPLAFLLQKVDGQSKDLINAGD
ncbi:MAG: hypothetical protein Q8L98_07690 [Chlamydiales bacterium]|nr:hypothetical protein [Chlamydiales bacterium]